MRRFYADCLVFFCRLSGPESTTDNNLIGAIKSAKRINFDLTPAGLRSLLQAKV